jgi:hypothetical protein
MRQLQHIASRSLLRQQPVRIRRRHKLTVQRCKLHKIYTDLDKPTNLVVRAGCSMLQPEIFAFRQHTVRIGPHWRFHSSLLCMTATGMRTKWIWRATAVITLAALAAVALWHARLRAPATVVLPLMQFAGDRASGQPGLLISLLLLRTWPAHSGMLRVCASVSRGSCLLAVL